MIDASNKQQRRASTSIQCKDPFLSATPYVEVEELELEHNINIDLLIHDHANVISEAIRTDTSKSS